MTIAQTPYKKNQIKLNIFYNFKVATFIRLKVKNVNFYKILFLINTTNVYFSKNYNFLC